MEEAKQNEFSPTGKPNDRRAVRLSWENVTVTVPAKKSLFGRTKNNAANIISNSKNKDMLSKLLAYQILFMSIYKIAQRFVERLNDAPDYDDDGEIN